MGQRLRTPDNAPLGHQRALRRGERGQGLILAAFVMVALLGFVALAIDVGSFYVERRKAQNAADAAVLAAAAELPEDAALAQAVALEWAEKNDVDLAAGDGLQVTISPDQTEVTVEVSHDEPFLFGKVLGLDQAAVSASAKAAVGAPASLTGVMPWAVLQSAINYEGGPTTIKYDAQGVNSGNFGAIRIDGNGANVYRNTIKYGSQNAVCTVSQPTCADPTQQTQPGNMIGPTRDGVNYRLDNTSTACDELDEVLVAKGNGTYGVRANCDPFENPDSLRVLLVPVIDSFCNGSCTVTLLYFTVMFLNDLGSCTGNDCEVTGTFVKLIYDPGAEFGVFDANSGIRFTRLVE